MSRTHQGNQHFTGGNLVWLCDEMWPKKGYKTNQNYCSTSTVLLKPLKVSYLATNNIPCADLDNQTFNKNAHIYGFGLSDDLFSERSGLRLFYGLNQQYLPQMTGFHDGPRPGSVQINSIFNGAVIRSSRVNWKWHQVVDYILGKYVWYWWNEIVEWFFKLYKLTNMNLIMEEKNANGYGQKVIW